MEPTRNIAARAGRWSARHRKAAVLGWLAFVVAALVLGGATGTKLLTDEEQGSGESGRADTALAKAFPQAADESVLVQSSKLNVDDPAFRAAVADVERRLGRVKGVKDVTSPYRSDAAISKNRKAVLVNLKIPGDDDATEKKIDSVLAATAAAQKAHPDLRIAQFGDASADKAISKSFEDDFKKAEITSLPVTLIILVIAFGALAAAGVPLLLAISSVAATIGLIGPISQFAPVSESISSVILLIGLAVGVDYAMFYLRREREERAKGAGERAALEAAAATSGRAVMISGFTVMIAMAGMYIAGDATFTSFATGTILVVAIAVLGSLTVLPAVLAKLGDRVEKGRIPFLWRLKTRNGESRVWNAVLDRVLRRPLAAALISGALLVALAVPALGLKTALPGVDTLPRDLTVMQTYDRIQAEFPGENIPATVVVQGDAVGSPQMKAAVASLQQQVDRSPVLEGRVSTETSPGGNVTRIDVPIAGNGTDAKSRAALSELRDDAVPAAFDPLRLKADVGGMTAQTEDFNSVLNKSMPLVFAFVLTAAFLLLLFTFRSIVIPLKAIALNLLSVGAAYGVLVLVFQEGVGQGLLGFDYTGGITAWLPLFLFVVLFGLSMDYHVFILSRVREAVDRGMSTDAAVAHGIKTTAGTVTSAALVMVAVFSIFATLSMIDFKQMGVGLAVAILIDATIIRAVLLPATMTLLGERNWYLPRFLGWVPRLQYEPTPEPQRA
ncbi:MAG TPA: MMPL family transporter [Thermoleophilaceae bacterium]|nr:MMPL family transporter [Thermoleophilaceae bacterium]